MSDKPTGGSAFPYEERDGDGKPVLDHFGMTLRDYFAAKAMQAYCSCSQWRLEATPEETAKIAYLMADAMLEARK